MTRKPVDGWRGGVGFDGSEVHIAGLHLCAWIDEDDDAWWSIAAKGMAERIEAMQSSDMDAAMLAAEDAARDLLTAGLRVLGVDVEAIRAGLIDCANTLRGEDIDPDGEQADGFIALATRGVP